MTRLDELQQCECEKLDPLFVDAYAKHYLDPTNESRLILDSSWGESVVDLSSAVKTTETITHLFLTPEATPRALQFNREDYGRDGAEDGGVDCIEGDALSRIISMSYLKDVDQQTPPRGGDVYMYNSTYNTFYTFNLQDYMDKTDDRLDDLEGRVSDLENAIGNVGSSVDIFDSRIKELQKQINNLLSRIEAIEEAIAKPSWAPADASIVWGTINSAYATDYFNKGLFSHNPASNVVGDMRFQ